MHTETSTPYISLIISLVFFTILLSLFLISLYKQSRFRIHFYKQRLQNEIEWVDKERERLSADLHDEVGSGLATIGILVRRTNSNDFAENQEKMIYLLDTQRQRLKEIVNDWAPSLLHSQGLQYALIDALEDMKSLHPVSIKYDIDIRDKSLDLVKSVHLFRIVKEVLTNILKHASAGRINFRAHYAGRFLLVEIENDGRRFDWPANKIKTAGNGLQNIKTRAEVISANIDIVYSKEKFTTWKIRVPIKQIIARDE